MRRKDRGTKGVVVKLLLLLVLAELLLLGGFVLYRAASPEEAAVTPAPTVPPSAEPVPTTTPTSTPAPTPAPTPEPSAAEMLLASMTLHEKVCQMFFVFPADLAPGTYTQAGPALADGLERFPVGGIFLNAGNMESKEQLRSFLGEMQACSDIPLLIACDEEGGVVSRLMDTVGTTPVDSMLTYKDQGTETAFRNGETIGRDMADLGFNLDLAPVADVWSNPANTVIGRRAYSDDFGQAAELVAAAVEGFHAGGVACTLKHFPGHGDTSEDSHYGSAYVYRSLEELRTHELLPFRAGIEAGADAVMIGHLIVTEISDEPALLSHELVTDLLRGELGFQGIIMTDALEMQALSDRYGTEEIVLRAVRAGVDMLLCPTDLPRAAEALERAVETGELAEDRIDESVLRILILKESLGE